MNGPFDIKSVCPSVEVLITVFCEHSAFARFFNFKPETYFDDTGTTYSKYSSRQQLHCVSKNIPNIFDSNLKKYYQIVIIFWCEYFRDNLPLNKCLIFHFTHSLFVHYPGKQNQQNIAFSPNAVLLFNLNNAQKHILLTFLTLWLTFIQLFCFRLPTAKLLKIWAHCANTSMETLSAFIDSSIDNVLLQTNPDFTSHFLNS